MTRHINSVLVLGLGKVGYLVGLLLHETRFTVTGGDINLPPSSPFPCRIIDISAKNSSLNEIFNEHDAVISCLPYHFNLGVARLAASSGVHYFDLTEDVEITKEIKTLKFVINEKDTFIYKSIVFCIVIFFTIYGLRFR